MPGIDTKKLLLPCLVASTLVAASPSSDAAEKFAGYAIVLQGFECDVVATHDGTVFAIENLGSFDVGDCVYIEGTLDACGRTCAFDKACILDNGIAPCCRGDATRDLVVDVNDLIAVVLEWGCGGETDLCNADVNADNRVDVHDVMDVITNWGPCAIP